MVKVGDGLASRGQDRHPVCTNDLPFLVPSVDGAGWVNQLALVGLTMDEKKVYRSDGRGRYREQSHKVAVGQSTTITWRGTDGNGWRLDKYLGSFTALRQR